MASTCFCTRTGFTYVIEAAGRIKIGRATVVADRVRDIQAMCPVAVIVLATSPGVALERCLHRDCKRWRLHGEWFEMAAWDHVAPLFSGPRCAACVRNVNEKKVPTRKSWAPSTYRVASAEAPPRARDLYSSSAAAKIVAAIRQRRG